MYYNFFFPVQTCAMLKEIFMLKGSKLTFFLFVVESFIVNGKDLFHRIDFMQILGWFETGL